MTSVELPPDLLKRARLYATRRGITLRALIEQLLRACVARDKEDRR